jgi:hypothetical protein
MRFLSGAISVSLTLDLEHRAEITRMTHEPKCHHDFYYWQKAVIPEPTGPPVVGVQVPWKHSDGETKFGSQTCVAPIPEMP